MGAPQLILTREQVGELRRLIRWWDGIAADYRAAIAATTDPSYQAELRQLEVDARAKVHRLREQLRQTGLP